MTEEIDHRIPQSTFVNPGRSTPLAAYELSAQLAAWQEALEARSCPPPPRLLDDEAATHLMTCERCRERARDEELIPPMYDVRVRHARETERPQRGEVWTLRSAHEGWKGDGRYVASASVFALSIDGKSAEVALVYEDGTFAAEGDFDLPVPDWGFVEAWNVFTVRTSELETRWANRDDDLLREVAAWRSLHGRRFVHAGCIAASPYLEKFRLLELTVASDLAADFFEPQPSEYYELTLTRLINHTDWGTLTTRLLCYAAMRTRYYHTRRMTPGKMPADYVQEAIMLVLDGRRRLPKSRNTSFFSFLCGVIDSLTSHDREPALRQQRYVFPAGDDDDDPDTCPERHRTM